MAARVNTAQPTHHQQIPRLAGYSDSMELVCMVSMYVVSGNVISENGQMSRIVKPYTFQKTARHTLYRVAWYFCVRVGQWCSVLRRTQNIIIFFSTNSWM